MPVPPAKFPARWREGRQTVSMPADLPAVTSLPVPQGSARDQQTESTGTSADSQRPALVKSFPAVGSVESSGSQAASSPSINIPFLPKDTAGTGAWSHGGRERW